jgi:predicted metalloendopeptidase
LRRPAIAATCLAAAVAWAQPPAQKSGLDVSSLDNETRPQDDLYRHANAAWLRQAEIPSDRVLFTTFVEVEERVNDDLRTLIEELRTSQARRKGSSAQQIVDLYASLMDETQLERLGATPMRGVLDRIQSIASPRHLAATAGHLSTLGAGGLFAVELSREAGPEARLVAQLPAGGFLLPEPRSYLADDPAPRELRARYQTYLTRLFELIGRADAASDSRAVIALETELARARASVASSEASRRYTLSELSRAMPDFDWLAWAEPQGLDRVAAVVLLQPSFFERFARLTRELPLAAWKAWLAARYVTACAPFLSDAFADARFEFFGRLLSGQEQPRTRWKRGVSLVSGYLGDALGRLYVERHSSRAIRGRAEALVANLLEAQRDALRQSDWIGPATRREALHKLSRLRVRVGWPDVWRRYAGLVIEPGDLLGNIQRAKRFEGLRRADGAWPVPPQTVNAAYDPATNEIVLPAALLQPPLFDAEAEDAVNYGALGAVIGHEIAHALTGRGAGIDGTGARRRWWAPQDEQAFAARAGRLQQQLAAARGTSVERSLGEDVADLCGLSVAFQAYARSLRGRPSLEVDGLRGEQRFFLAWARAWRAKVRNEYLQQWSLQTAHAPPQLRVNGVVRNLEGFHAAFGVRPEDRLYKPPVERAVFW